MLKDPAAFPITHASLAMYVQNSPTVDDLDRRIADAAGRRLLPYGTGIQEPDLLRYFGRHTIKDIEEDLKQEGDRLVEFKREQYKTNILRKVPGFLKGVSVQSLVGMMVLETGERESVARGLSSFYWRTASAKLQEADRLLRILADMSNAGGAQ